MKIRSIIDISESLNYLGQLDDLLCAYPIAKNINKVKEHVEKFSHDKKSKIDEHVMKGENGAYKLTEDKTSFEFGKNLVTFEKEVEALKDVEVEIEFETFGMDELKNGKGEKVNPPAVVLANLIDVIIK